MNKIVNFEKTNSLMNHFIAELRDEKIQKDRMRFRRNMERVGEIMAYEISKTLDFNDVDVNTPLGITHTSLIESKPVIATILRAGLPFHQGFLNYFDQADAAFISAFRKTKKNNEFIIEMEYVAVPELENKTVIMVDPMLATGSSMVLCCKELMSRANIKELHVVSVIASMVGVQHVKKNLPNAKIWVAAIDDELTTKSYIVPGLGDAGDLCFGEKY